MPRKTWIFMLLGLTSLLLLATQANRVVINADDLLRFDVRTIKVPSGSQVDVTLHNVGNLKNHGHNFVLLKQGADMGKFSRSDAKSSISDTFLRDIAVAYTTVAMAGETVNVSFRAPEPGQYIFICSWPGHQSLSKGTFTVE